MKTKAVIENGFKEIEIGLIPEDWETTTLENEKLFEFANGLWKGKKVPFVTAKVIRNTNFNNDGTLSLDNVAELDVEERQFIKRQLSGGDIILERSGGGPKQPVGRVVFFDLKEVNYSFSNFTTRIRVKDINKIQPKYILYYLLHFYNRGCTYELQQRTTGIRNLNFKDYKKIQVPLPSLTEQRKIAFVLLKIQQATEQQHRIIETTRELKKSLMNKLFTEGLHGEEQKETEIGLIPKKWDVIEVDNLGEIITGTTPPTNNKKYYTGGGFQFISPVDLGDTKYVYKTKKEISLEGLRVSRVLPKDAVLIVCIGSTTGKVGLTFKDKSTTNQQINTVICKDEFNPHFIYYLLNFECNYIRSLSTPSPVPILSKGKFQRAKIPIVKNKQEQDKIAEILSAIDEKIEKAEYRKQTLQALFKTMLNQLMTGKVRVKDFDFEVN